MGKFLPKLWNSILPTWLAKLKKMLLQQPISAGNLLPYNRLESPIQEQAQDLHTCNSPFLNNFCKESNRVNSLPNPSSLPPPSPTDGRSLSAISIHSLLQESPSVLEGGGDGERESLPYEREDCSGPSGRSMEAGLGSKSAFDIANEVEGSSFPQVQNSYSPYEDLRDSMKEMIAFHRYTRDVQVLGYILYSYFSLNEPFLYDAIERAFVDACEEVFQGKV